MSEVPARWLVLVLRVTSVRPAVSYVFSLSTQFPNYSRP